MRVLVADICTDAAPDAFLRIVHYLVFCALGFGIVTPGTAQGTALEEYGRACSRTVMHTEPLYFGYGEADVAKVVIFHFVLLSSAASIHPEL